MYTTDLIFDFDNENLNPPKKYGQFIYLQYESFNTIKNLGSIFWILSFDIIALTIYLSKYAIYSRFKYKLSVGDRSKI